MNKLAILLGVLVGTMLHAPSAQAESADSYGEESKSNGPPYVFGWYDYPEPTLKLRGGTTTGTPVTVASEASEEWKALRADNLSDLERDRLAILAMAGEYRASFDFLEVELYGENQLPTSPYRSWGTERVYVLEESEELISLQHILVMFFEDENGTVQGPMVMKHWRQDWVYEPASALEFIGESQWTNRMLSDEERMGQWQQTVYQVDDSPRYAMRGQWTHNASFSSWDGLSAWRPLPRREFSVRSDYQALVGTNRITIHPRGWVHTQDNIKTVLSAPGQIDEAFPALGRELGVNRYDRIVDFDFSEGDVYFEQTADYWEGVRNAWTTHLSSATTVYVDKHCNEERTFMTLFGLAAEEPKKPKAKKKRAEAAAAVVSCVVKPVAQ